MALWNLRVSAALHQGDRKYMEDQYAIHYECDKETGQFLYVYFGIFDGHGGADAAKYAKAHLHKNITSNSLFFSDQPADVKKSIREGFLQTHEDMWKDLGQWPTTATGLPSTAGTTASVVFIKGDKIYTGHVGDSGIALGLQKEYLGRGNWKSQYITIDHKPDSPIEKSRIEKMGGRVVPKAGVPRVVWQRPREKGPVRRTNQIDHIPFLAVGRALGDLWSYNFDNRQYAISPDPDVDVVDFNPYQQKCLVLATDGMWNLIDAKAAIKTVEMTERKWFREAIYEKGFPKTGNPYYHHASTLVNLVLRRWRSRNLRADNTSAIVVMIDPPGLNVSRSVDKIAALADDTRVKGKKFCARAHNKANEEYMEDCERYLTGMAGSYNIQYYDDRDRFELHYGKPAVRYNVPRNDNNEKATASVAMYDVIIHKVMTPAKSTTNLASLQSPLNTFSKLRKTQSSKDLRKFRPQAGVLQFGSWIDKDKFGHTPSMLCDSPTMYSGAKYDSNKSLVVDRSPGELPSFATKTEPQEVPSPTVSSPESSNDITNNSHFPDSTSSITPPTPPSSLIESRQVATRSNTVIKRLKGAVAKSLVSLHDHIRPATRRSTGALNAKPDTTSSSRCLRRTSRRPLAVKTSPLKVKRRSSSVDLLSTKRQRLSAPCVQLTKVTAVTEPSTKSICLRPRQKS